MLARGMSYHAPHMLKEDQLQEMEARNAREAVAAVEVGSSKVKQGPKEAGEGRKPVVIWEVYEYDYQTGRYERPRALFAEEEAARECKRELGMVGVRKLTVWPGLEEWNAAWNPPYHI